MKTKSTIPSVLLAACLALQPTLVYSQSTSELLEKGIYAEETKGDIEGAITIYQKLIDEAKAN